MSQRDNPIENQHQEAHRKLIKEMKIDILFFSDQMVGERASYSGWDYKSVWPPGKAVCKSLPTCHPGTRLSPYPTYGGSALCKPPKISHNLGKTGVRGGSFAMIYLFFLSHKFLSLLHMYSFICCLLPFRMRVRIFVSRVHKTYDQETQNLSAQKQSYKVFGRGEKNTFI